MIGTQKAGGKANARAREFKLSLSRLLALAAEEYLDRHAPPAGSPLRGEEKARRLKEINEAWADGLDEEERTVLHRMQKKYLKTVKELW